MFRSTVTGEELVPRDRVYPALAPRNRCCGLARGGHPGPPPALRLSVKRARVCVASAPRVRRFVARAGRRLDMTVSAAYIAHPQISIGTGLTAGAASIVAARYPEANVAIVRSEARAASGRDAAATASSSASIPSAGVASTHVQIACRT